MNHIKIILTIFLLLSPFSSFAAHETEDHEHQKSDIKEFSIKDHALNQGEVLLNVHGVVCSFCSYGIQKKLSKIDFVDTKKYSKGAEINIKNQTIIIAIKKDKKADLEMIFASIKSGGYNPIKAYFLSEDGKVISVSPSE